MEGIRENQSELKQREREPGLYSQSPAMRLQQSPSAAAVDPPTDRQTPTQDKYIQIKEFQGKETNTDESKGKPYISHKT